MACKGCAARRAAIGRAVESVKHSAIARNLSRAAIKVAAPVLRRQQVRKP